MPMLPVTAFSPLAISCAHPQAGWLPTISKSMRFCAMPSRATEHGDAAMGTKGIAVPAASARDGERHVAHILPLTSGARRRAEPQP